MGIFLISLWDTAPARKGQSVTALFAVIAGIVVMAAGLWLQHICRLPEDPDEQQQAQVPHRR